MSGTANTHSASVFIRVCRDLLFRYAGAWSEKMKPDATGAVSLFYHGAEASVAEKLVNCNVPNKNDARRVERMGVASKMGPFGGASGGKSSKIARLVVLVLVLVLVTTTGTPLFWAEPGLPSPTQKMCSLPKRAYLPRKLF